MSAPIVAWFRRDLRLSDNPALEAALRSGQPVIPLYIWSPEEEAPWSPGAASRWWLGRSLGALKKELERIGSRLVVRRGPALETLRELARESGASAVVWNRLYEPSAVSRDKALKAALASEGFRAESFKASLLFEPWEVCTNEGRPYQVFTPFWKAALRTATPGVPLARPKALRAPEAWPRSETLESLELEPSIPWHKGFEARFEPGEPGALLSLRRFAGNGVEEYARARNYPALRGTSRLSPHLHFGEVSPREVWHAVRDINGEGADAFRKELGWREFAHHLIFHFPSSQTAPLRPEYESFPWREAGRDAEAELEAWRRGRTGYPIVDAGLRELWATGWMHNRVRMIVASFLVKDLRLSWLEGARWFWDTLVDADLASNTLGWQWAAGCGADAAPFFRVFNPTLQGRKFDPKGEYIRRWVPELAALPAERIHEPGLGPSDAYPPPIVDHAAARLKALELWERFRS